MGVVAVFTLILLFAGLVAASPAFATTTFFNEDPAADTIVGTNMPPLAVTGQDDGMVDIVSGDITVGGFHVGDVTLSYPNFPDLTQATVECDTSTGPGLPWGLNTATVTVQNSLGEVSSFDWSFTTDVPPTIASVTPAESSVVTSTLRPPISIKVDDADDAAFGGVIFRVDTLANRPYTYTAATKTFSWTPTANLSDHAVHTVTFQCMDAAGSIVNKVFTFRIDTTSQMTFSGRTPASGSTVTSATVPIDITVQADDPRYVIDMANTYNQILLDSVPLVTTVSYPVPADTTIALLRSDTLMTDGAHTVTARVQDIQGLNATDTWSFTVAAPPVASEFEPAVGTSSSRPLIRAKVWDNGPGTPTVNMTVDSAAVASTYSGGYVSYTPAADLAQGSHTVDLSMTDASGNSSNASWSFQVIADTTVTWSNRTPAPGSTLATNNAMIGATASSAVDLPAANAKLYVDGSLVTAAVVQTTAKQLDVNYSASNLADGTHPVRLEVVDTFGNPSSNAWSFDVKIAPTLTDPVPIPGSVADPRPTFSITARDNMPGNLTVRFILDSVQVFSGSRPQGVVSWTPASNLALGAHTVTAEAVDAAGNLSSYTWNFTVADTMTARHTTKTDPFTACTECHNQAINTEHANRGFDCDTCHNSTDPAVVQAIADNNTACEACHTGNSTAHQALHNGGTAAPDCLECHKSNISEEHENNCDKCHKSTDAKVVAAIAAGDRKCTACHVIHPPGFYRINQDYYKWTTTPGPRDTGNPLGDVGSNPANPGVHANYLATSAKCGMCHSVHRAWGTGVKLLPTDNTTCACCHVGTTAITAKLVTWTPYSTTWVPEVAAADPLYPVGSDAWNAASPDERVAAIINKADAGGAATNGGPHNDSLVNLIEDGLWDGTGTAPEIGYDAGHRYGCFTRRCHASNPHGANSSNYKLFAAKLLFNDTPAQDDVESGKSGGTYGGLDAAYDNLGASDAAVKRFVDANPGVIRTTPTGDIEVNKNGTGWRAPDANETHAIVAGLTCGRPSNPSTGEDECHAEASYAIFDKGVKELRNAATGITAGSAYRTDNTGSEAPGYGGNDSRTLKTGHVAGTFAAVPSSASYAAIGGCVSCHDQTDAANTVFGNYTFPHGQAALGATNLHLSDGSDNTSGTAGWARARLWMGYGANAGSTLTAITGTNEKAYDGNCLKCHRDATNTQGIGLTK